MRKWDLTGKDTEELLASGEAILHEDGTLSVYVDFIYKDKDEHFCLDFKLQLQGQEVKEDFEMPF